MSDTDQTEDQQRRAFAKALFGGKPDEPDEPEQKPPGGNFVPKEGNNPKPPRGDQEMREFTAALFDRDPNA